MFEIVVASETTNQSLELIKAFFKLEGLTYTREIDPRFVLQATKGRVHPTFGFVVLAKTGELLRDIYDVVRYVEAAGLKRC